MLELDEIKKLSEMKKKSEKLISDDIVIGMQITTDDFKNKATIIGLCDGKAVLSNRVYNEDGPTMLDMDQLYNEWLFVLPNGSLIPCAVPPQQDKEIITPNDLQFIK